MKSKTSCFNRTIFFKNFTRFWPIWSLYLAILFFSMPVTLYFRTHNTKVPGTSTVMGNGDKLYYMLTCIDANFAPFLVCAFSIISAIAVFSYLYSSRSCYMIHSLPVTRGELYVTNYISGLSFLLLPQLLIFLLSIFVCIANNVTSVEYIFWWLIFSMGMSFFFYSVSVFCCMLTGQPFAAFAFFTAGNILYVILKFLIGSTVSIFCYGFDTIPDIGTLSQGKDAFLSPLMHLSYKVNIQYSYSEYANTVSDISINGKSLIALYALLAVGTLLLTFFFYRKRHLECAGDILAVNWTKPLFRWLSSIVAGLGFALFFRFLFFADHDAEMPIFLVTALLFGLFFFLLAEMILRKRFWIFASKRIWLEWCGCAGILLFMLLSIQGNLYGTEQRIPEKKQIESIIVNGDYQMYLTEKSDFDKVLDLHQSLIDNKDDYTSYYRKNSNNLPDVVYQNDGSYYTTSTSADSNSNILRITMYYHLKNGKRLARSYYLPASDSYRSDPESSISKLTRLESNADAFLKSNICYNYRSMNITSGTFTAINHKNGNSRTLSMTTDQAKAIYLAIQKDINAGHYPFHYLSGYGNDTGIYYNDISIDGKVPGTVVSLYDKMPSDYHQYQNSSLDLWSNIFGILSTDYGSIDERLNSISSNSDSSFSNLFTISRDCSYTIQELIDQGIIHSEKDLITQSDYFNITNQE